MLLQSQPESVNINGWTSSSVRTNSAPQHNMNSIIVEMNESNEDMYEGDKPKSGFTPIETVSSSISNSSKTPFVGLISKYKGSKDPFEAMTMRSPGHEMLNGQSDLPKRHVSDKWNNAYNVSKQDSWVQDLNRNNLELSTSGFETSPVKESGYEDLPVISQEFMSSMHDGASIFPEDDEDSKNKNNSGDSQFSSKSRGKDPISSDSLHSGLTDGFSDTEFKVKMSSHTKEGEEISESHTSSHSHQNATDSEKSKQQNDSQLELFMPSEYVNQGHDESFDGRRMGLSHKTFDDALIQMLGMEEQQNGPLTISHEDYDQYARVPMHEKKWISPGGPLTKKPGAVYNTQKQSNSRGNTRSREQRKPVSADTWAVPEQVSAFKPFSQNNKLKMSDC